MYFLAAALQIQEDQQKEKKEKYESQDHTLENCLEVFLEKNIEVSC